MKDISFTYYRTNGQKFSMDLNRESILAKMRELVKKYPDCNDNATTLLQIIPEIETMEIYQFALDSQDVPYIVYNTFSHAEKQLLKFRGTYRIKWEYFKSLCREAEEKNK